MLLHCAVLIGAAIQAQMGSNASPRKENLHGSPGKAHIHLLLDVFIWDGVIHALHTDMVVVLDCGHLPDRQFEWRFRKGQQEQLFLCKAGCPAAFPFLEWLMVKGFQLLPDGLIQFRQG